jgi:hypothetical protein
MDDHTACACGATTGLWFSIRLYRYLCPACLEKAAGECEPLAVSEETARKALALVGESTR